MCPPCRGFTPQLASWYGAGLCEKLEIVFVSSDRDQASFDTYFEEMPWLALPFTNREAKEALSRKYEPVNKIFSTLYKYIYVALTSGVSPH